MKIGPQTFFKHGPDGPITEVSPLTPPVLSRRSAADVATLGSHTRLLALVGLVAAAALAGGYFFFLRPAAATPGAAQPVTKVPPRQTPPRVAKTTRTPPVSIQRAPTGLPAALDRALRRHSVVVVSLFASDVPLDRTARAESSAGARDAGAGFVSLNVLNRKQSERLVLKTGVVSAPSVLVFRRPDRLVLHLDGFVDRTSVAQAVTDARR